ncbi:MAG: C4-type zinc ribbon domain-containing protein [Mucinivorans sp.]
MATKTAKQANDIVELSTGEKIAALYELQTIDSRIDQINFIKGSLPLEISDMQDEIAGIEAKIADYVAQSDTLLSDVKTKKSEIEAAKIAIAKYEEQQKEVRNNREFESIGKEVEFQQLEIELCEKRIKEFNAESKAKKALASETKDIITDRKKELQIKQIELESIESETSEELKNLGVKRDELHGKIEKRVLDAYTRIRSNTRNGLAVVTVTRNACGGCFNRIPPQRQIDIQNSKKVIVCEYCGRILVSSDLDPLNQPQ